MTNTNMTPGQENAFYAEQDKQVAEGPPVRRKAQLSEPVPVRFPEELVREFRNTVRLGPDVLARSADVSLTDLSA